ncbi:ATP-binding protein [Umezawaea beigongshangensis]|uniref:ATP-binding protein n=1 Tax=Umezawaea beigongshangensis TaxID=2780383 RepID=UPI0018F18FE2|nr:tetratricopeptide repeat protein [Umezawaea beigongshangensis]
MDVRNRVAAESVGNVVQVGVAHFHPAAPVVPCQLPAVPAPFAGRVVELAVLDRRAPVNVIVGMGGIGKTWLAVRWAHLRREWFPDGQLFVDLRGFSPEGRALASERALRAFLAALGVPHDAIPVDLDAQASVYRSLLADKQVLIVLDNAADARQVEPLLPGCDTCTVLVTSRRRLKDLITRYDARHLPLDVFGSDDAHAVLVRRLDAGRIAVEPTAVADLLRLCAGFPLTLGIVAAGACTHPKLPLTEFAAELRDLDMPELHDTVLTWSLRRMPAAQRTAFALLAHAPGPDIGLPAAARLIDLPHREARVLLNDLTDASLLERRPDSRYALHGLVRAFATGLRLPASVRAEALSRVVHFYTTAAHAADRVPNPSRPALAWRGDPPVELHDLDTAQAWFDREHANLLSAQLVADHPAVWHLAWCLNDFHRRRDLRHDELATWQAALSAADHLADPHARTRAHRFLGRACNELGHYESAAHHLNQALALSPDPVQHAHAHRELARTWSQCDDDHRALHHATRALEIFCAADEPVSLARSFNQIGWYTARLGDYDTARAHCRTSLALHRELDDPDGLADTENNLGHIGHRAVRHLEALTHYTNALTAFRIRGSTWQTAQTLNHLAHTHAALDRHDQARAAWTEAQSLYHRMGRFPDPDRATANLHPARYSQASSPPPWPCACRKHDPCR